MVWCSHCVEDVKVVTEPDQDYTSCSFCGKILVCPIYKSHRMIGKPEKFKGLHGRAAYFLGCPFDIDDLEVAQYVHNEKDKRLRKIIWEEMNKEYLEVQATKNAAIAAAAKGACQAILANGSKNMLSGQDLVTLTTEALSKSKKEKKHKHLTVNRSSTSTKSHGRDLKCKSFSSKINYKVLEGLYKVNAKKERTTSEIGECENHELKTIEETLKTSEESTVSNAKDLVNVGGGNDDDNNEGDDYYENGEGDDYYENGEGDDYYENGEADDYYENGEADDSENPDEEYD